jgi:hypothetical protein
MYGLLANCYPDPVLLVLGVALAMIAAGIGEYFASYIPKRDVHTGIDRLAASLSNVPDLEEGREA